MHSNLTAGAIRTFILATELARKEGKVSIEASDVLWSLVLQETRAGEILGERGVTVETLRLLIQPPAGWDDMEVMEAVSQVDIDATHGIPHPIAQQSLIHQVLHHARENLTDLLSQTEFSTEHILCGLVLADENLARELQRHGVTFEFLVERMTGQKAALPPEMKSEFTLRYRENRQTEDMEALRILDAAANRAREGLRVLEDYVRFVLDDGHLSERLKEWRHELASALNSLLPHRLLQARETQRDVGTNIHLLTETRRESLLSVIQANFKRVEESLRTLEEYGKLLNEAFGQEVGRLRYGVYTLEKAVLLTRQSRERLAGRLLYMLVTEDLCHHGSGPAVRDAIQGGVGIVQLREKRLSDRELITRARRLREWTRESDVFLIINDRPDIAVLCDADGVHVGQDELTVKDARRILGPDKLVGVSTHSIEQARQAVLDGADYIGVGPVFSSSTKTFDQLAGLNLVRQVTSEIRLPAYAIGGISLDNLDEVLGAGAERVAVTAALCGSATPFEAAKQFMAKLGASRRDA